MKILKTVLLASILLLLMAGLTGCTGSRILPNQLYDFFGTGDFAANYWVRGGNVLPYIQSEHVHKGKYAVEFSNVADGDSSEMYIDLVIEQGSVIRFYVNTFSEAFDNPLLADGQSVLRFYIDDTLAGSWFGQNEWKSVIRELPEGEHRLKWEFMSASEVNKAWLDDIMISKLIPLGEKIEFKDDELKRLVLSQIGKLGGEAALVNISTNEFFEDIRAAKTFLKSFELEKNMTRMINTNVRYSEGEVYANEVSDIEALNIFSFSPLTDLTGIEHFSNLLSLFLLGPGVNDISPLTELKKIRTVLLLMTSIEDITPLNTSGQSGALEIFGIMNEPEINDHLSDQSIDALGTWISLKTLFLSNLDIADSEFLSNLINLEQLGLQAIEISDINPLSALRNLEILDLSNMPIDDIEAVRDLRNVTLLYLNNNLIEDISPIVQGLITTLERLDIYGNLLDLTPGSEDMLNIEKLLDAGIIVIY